MKFVKINEARYIYKKNGRRAFSIEKWKIFSIDHLSKSMDLFIGLSADFAIIIAKEGRNEKMFDLDPFTRDTNRARR